MHDINQQILQELEAIAFARAADVVKVTGGKFCVADTDSLTPAQLAAVASVEHSSTGIKVKFYDKLKALELLGKAGGLFDGAAAPAGDNGLLEAIVRAASGGEEGMDN